MPHKMMFGRIAGLEACRMTESELAEACSPRHYNVSVLAWSPLLGGALTGKYLGGNPKNSRFDLFPDRYPRYNTHRVHKATEKYVKIAHEVGCTPAQLAIAFCRCAGQLNITGCNCGLSCSPWQ